MNTDKLPPFPFAGHSHMIIPNITKIISIWESQPYPSKHYRKVMINSYMVRRYAVASNPFDIAMEKQKLIHPNIIIIRE